MKLIGISGACVAVVLFGMSSARAADWSGVYAGAQIGGVIGESDVTIPNYPSQFDFQPAGVAGGLHVGYNYEVTDSQGVGFVLGIEADANGLDAVDSHLSGGPVASEEYFTEQYWDVSLRPRVGIEWNRFLGYVTGGVAFSELGTSYTDLVVTDTDTLIGFTVGAGAEMMFGSGISGRIQYLYSGYGKNDFVHFGPSTVDYDTHKIQIGVSVNLSTIFGGK